MSPDEIEPPQAAVDWDAVRADYESDEGTLDGICLKHGITRSALSYRVRNKLWTPRYRGKGLSRPQIIDRMFRLLERQIIQLEQDMKETGEKEVAVLGKLATTLEKLIEIDKAESGKQPGPAKSPAQHKEMEELRNKLAQRLAQLRRG
ncbi:MAG TPA: hypothetical protein VHB74_16485 [Devosia sp.]|nr:hypothetical protein [Devosia sp.]